MKTSSLYCAASLLIGLLVAGCSTTTTPIVISEWRNPTYSSASFSRIMIGGLGGDVSTRRNFEDEFIFQLRAAGADGVASYRYLPEGSDANENRLRDAARKAGVEALILTRLVRVEEMTQYSGSFAPPISFGVFGSNAGATWSGLGGAPSAYRVNEYTAETALHDIAKNEVVWSVTTKTSETDGGRTAIKSTVEAVVKSLAEKNLLRRQQ
jgi:hypothetical protein